jgi:putative tryptophan/tyrosine transport system substrate-binding protein
MRRRQFLAGIGAAIWPLAARAQQGLPLVGFASAGSAAALRRDLAGFERGLAESGTILGQNASIEYRFAEGQFDRFPAFMSEFVERKASVIVTSSNPGAHAARNATATIPIVFSIGNDPVKLGLVPNLNRPDGNLTGVYQFSSGLEGKRLSLLREMVPRAATLGVLIQPNFSPSESQVRDVQQAAASLGIKVVIARANAEAEFDAAFTHLVDQKAEGLLVAASPFFNIRRQQLVVLAARHGLPAMYEWRDFAEAGGLMSYGTRLADAFYQAGIYAGRILKGAKPSDLPVVQVTKFDFVINLNTAKALRIEVPPALSARADEVIE